jgi:hypothetical protein
MIVFLELPIVLDTVLSEPFSPSSYDGVFRQAGKYLGTEQPDPKSAPLLSISIAL